MPHGQSVPARSTPCLAYQGAAARSSLCVAVLPGGYAVMPPLCTSQESIAGRSRPEL